MVMAIATDMKLTVRDYLSLSEEGGQHQLIEGELHTMAPAPNRFHQEISGNLFFILASYLQKNRIGKIYSAPFDVILDDANVLQPDLLYVSQARQSILTDGGAEGAPDVVVEVLSARTSKLDLQKKRAVYARSGVDEMWIVDPEGLEVRIYRFAERADRPVAIHYSGDRFESRHFSGLIVEVDAVFAQ